MYEFEVVLQTGEKRFIFGYNQTDALRRYKLEENQVKRWLTMEYVDRAFGRGFPPDFFCAFFTKPRLRPGRRGTCQPEFWYIGKLHKFGLDFLCNITTCISPGKVVYLNHPKGKGYSPNEKD